ncbi:MAG: 50S ribosomal protein L21e [Candidatus Altiarchaeales archaeon ex4484_2]|nr:MAG: 50S ribosomal protein L21e [Candidatus Altiarchaeales archaeon ex4484_2]
MKGSKGYRRKTRNLKVKPRNRGKLKIRNYLQEFDEGDKVVININPSYQKIPHPRFNSKVGAVSGKQGRAYYVQIRDGNKNKKVLVTPEHLISLTNK